MTSSRFPGKVLHTCGGKPLLGWTLSRLSTLSSLTQIAVITSTEQSDDPISHYCSDQAIACFRGNLHNVLERYLQACRFFQVKYFVRICGDSPLIDSSIVSRALRIFSQADVDIVTNTFKRTYPKGQSVEVVSRNALERLSTYDLSSSEREHVTSGFYNRSKIFRIFNFESHYLGHANTQLSVDTRTDLHSLSQFLGKSCETSSCDWLTFALKLKDK